jgi:hypothetical protein
MKSHLAVSVLGMVLLAGQGCMPPNLVEAIGPAARRNGAGDAEARPVAGRGYLRFDTALESDLEDVMALDNLKDLQSEGSDVIRKAQSLGRRAVEGEIERLPEESLTQLMKVYRPEVPDESADRRAALKHAFIKQSESMASRDVMRLQSARGAEEARRMLRAIRGGIEPPAGDRGKLARALVAAPLFVPAAIGAEIAEAESRRRDLIADFARVIKYQPSTAIIPSPAGLKALDLEALARRYAPVLVQQVDPNARYEAANDRIGRVYLTGTAKKAEVHVDPQNPVLYWTHRQAKVGQRRFDQLIYAAWYPSRPALAEADPSAGRIDGVVVRITLDGWRRPAIYEFVRSCGCYHTLWVAEFVEATARREFGPPLRAGACAVQKAGSSREHFMPALVRDDGARPDRARVWINAGEHLVMSIGLDEGVHPSLAPDATLTYSLERYENLTRLPVGDDVASMFGSDGLVHDAGRAEGWLLAPTGMLSAGQPRQVGTMKIRMDAYDYDDPRLLERNLRLPSALWPSAGAPAGDCTAPEDRPADVHPPEGPRQDRHDEQNGQGIEPQVPPRTAAQPP